MADEEYYYCGFYYGFNSSLFNHGTVFTKVVAINNLNQDKDSMDLILDLEVSTDSVSVSPMIANISSGADLAMRSFTQGKCRDATDALIEGSTPIACSKHMKTDVF